MQFNLQKYDLFLYYEFVFSTMTKRKPEIFRLPIPYIAFLLLITFCCSPLASLAQSGSDSSPTMTHSITYSHGYKWTALSLGGALGYGVYRDMGTAPIRFNGLAIQPSIGLEFNGDRKWITTFDAFTSVGVFEDALAPKFNFGSFDICNTLRFRMRKNIACLFKENGNEHLQLRTANAVPDKLDVSYASFSLGLGVANLLDVTVNPDYENAAAGISDFVGPELSLRTDLPLCSFFSLDPTKPDKQLFAEVGFMPFAAVLRPGYSYIDNYTASHPVASTLLHDFEWHLKPMAALWSNVGFDIINAPFSRLSVSYRWAYFSSGNTGAWRVDHATHYLHFDFVITLKQKQTE